jgi:hypothetical protein
MRCAGFIAWAFVASWILAEVVHAQSGLSGSTSQNGLFGNRTIGAPFLQNSGPTFTGRGASSVGQGFGSSGSAGVLTGNERFLPQNDEGRFIGRTAEAARALFDRQFRDLQQSTDSSNMGRRSSSRRRLGAAADEGIRSREGQGFSPDSPNGRRSTYVHRPRYRVGFEPPVVNAAQLTAALTERLEKFLLQGGSTQIEVSVQNRTASLEGSVTSDDDRRLAERLVSLEPGVDRIENRLVVEPASTGEAAGLDR